VTDLFSRIRGAVTRSVGVSTTLVTAAAPRSLRGVVFRTGRPTGPSSSQVQPPLDPPFRGRLNIYGKADWKPPFPEQARKP
jgi:hypothetical protein